MPWEWMPGIHQHHGHQSPGITVEEERQRHCGWRGRRRKEEECGGVRSEEGGGRRKKEEDK